MLTPLVEHAFEKYRDNRTFHSLDGIRALCILAVIWHHVPTWTECTIFQRGFLGVDMFFVLSGFLIVTLLLREKDRQHRISLKNFYIRRALRIFPIYYLVLFLVLLMYVATKASSSNAQMYYRKLPFLLTYTSNWVEISVANMGIMWSLATEEQFYLLWPAIEKPSILCSFLSCLVSSSWSIS